jgi:hypothetical protein
MFPTPFLSLPLIFLSKELLFLMKELHSPSFFPLYFLYFVHLFQSLGEALLSLEEGSWIHPARYLANNFAYDFRRTGN